MGSHIVNLDGNESYIEQIRKHFRSQIRSQQLRPGEKLPSIRQLSDACGVSVSIVKQALSTLYTEGYLRSHPGRGIFVAEPRLSRKNIALVLPSLDNEQMPQIIRGVKQALSDGSGRLIVQAADYDFDEEMDLLANLDSNFIAGAIIYPPPLNSYIEPLRQLQQRGVPFVLVDTFFDALDVHAVSTDRFELGRLAFEHLIENGHRKIGMLDHDADATSIERTRQGANQALQKVGLCYDDLYRTCSKSDQLDKEHPWTSPAAIDLLIEHPGITAITGINDNTCMGAFQAAKTVGLRVPEDISVIGIGGLSALTITDPPVTAVEQDHQQMGYLAAQHLMTLLNDSSVEINALEKHVRLSPALRVRGSVSCAGERELQMV